MRFRWSRWALVVSVIAAILFTAARVWAVFYPLGPDKDEWGLKYAVEVTAVAADKLNIHFTLADEGRLKPIYSATVVAFSNLRSDGGRTYLVKELIDLKRNPDGHLVGTAQIGKEFVDRASIRILTVTFDGRPQSAGARYYDIPLKKFLNKALGTASRQTPRSMASPPASKVTK